MSNSYYERHPWAVNIYQGKTHLYSAWFQREEVARFYFQGVALRVRETAHLMRYQGNYKWQPVEERARRIPTAWPAEVS